MVAKGLLPYKPRLSTYPYNSDAKKEGENPGPVGLSAIPGPSSSGEFDLELCIDFKIRDAGTGRLFRPRSGLGC